ncbi:hypothetical protein RvY_17231 [Ramazzottius varieornatus]|uniref:Uncharacterized protein n=1 Tax=Ramazzottius varieornatus TaxID=947166 RepID=A0A1D1W3R0_RAMVA|nr:hypothetical protein RvY_17231 [Ramazzottius varieornatus]
MGVAGWETVMTSWCHFSALTKRILLCRIIVGYSLKWEKKRGQEAHFRTDNGPSHPGQQVPTLSIPHSFLLRRRGSLPKKSFTVFG